MRQPYLSSPLALPRQIKQVDEHKNNYFYRFLSQHLKSEIENLSQNIQSHEDVEIGRLWLGHVLHGLHEALLLTGVQVVVEGFRAQAEQLLVLVLALPVLLLHVRKHGLQKVEEQAFSDGFYQQRKRISWVVDAICFLYYFKHTSL